MVVTIDASVRPLADMPAEMTALLDHWHELRKAREWPLRRDVDPVRLGPYMGSLCIIEIVQEPFDLVYRLFGSSLVRILQQDLTGQPVRTLMPAGLGTCLHRHLGEAITEGAPRYFRTIVHHDQPPGDAAAGWLVLPLSKHGKTVDQVLTYTRFDTVEPEFWLRITR